MSHMCRVLMGLFMAFCALTVNVEAAFLLPNGKQQFEKSDGAPCSGCGVYMYYPDGSTAPKDTWTSSDRSSTNTHPIELDALGSAVIYGAGTYRQVLCSTFDGATCTGTVLWDQTVSAGVSLEQSWGGTSGGSANAQTLTQDDFSFTDGQVLTFLAGATNTGATTLTLNSSTAKAVVRDTSSGPVALSGSEITVGNVVSVLYVAATEQFHLLTPTPLQSIEGAVFFNGFITPTVLASDQDDWTPTGGFSGANTVRVSSTADIAITGLTDGAAGRTVFLHNIGNFKITLTPEGSGSTAANRSSIAKPRVLLPNDGLVLQYDALSSRWRELTPGSTFPVAGGFRNLLIVNGGTPDEIMTVTADALTVENSDGAVVRLTSVSVSPDITASGENGLDTGSVTTSSWYSIWVIYNPSTDTVAGLFSTSASSPTLPSGYTYKARVGWNRTDGSSDLNRIRQQGRRAAYVVASGTPTANLPNMGTGSARSVTTPTWVAVSVSNYVPSTARSIDVMGTTVGTSVLLVAPNNQYGADSSTSNPAPLGVSGNSGSNRRASKLMPLQSTSIYWAASNSSARIFCAGWEDNF